MLNSYFLPSRMELFDAQRFNIASEDSGIKIFAHDLMAYLLEKYNWKLSEHRLHMLVTALWANVAPLFRFKYYRYFVQLKKHNKYDSYTGLKVNIEEQGTEFMSKILSANRAYDFLNFGVLE